MTRSKTKTVKVKQRRTAPSKNQRGHLGFAYSDHDVNDTVGLSDPFSEEARGTKIPDDNSSKSFTVQVRAITSMASDASGLGALRIRPSLSETFKPGATFSGSSVDTWGGSVNVGDYLAVSSAADKFRIVSWGVRVYSQLAPTEQKGSVRYITTPETTSSAAFDYGTSFFEEKKIYPVSEDAVHWTSKPVGNVWKEYISMSEAHSWDYLTLVGTGMQASEADAITVEIVFNLECQPNLGSISGALSNEAAPHKPHVLAAAGEVLKNQGGAMVRTGASNFFRNAARMALNFIGQRFAGISAGSQLLPSRPLRMIGN